jgi:hypothetical protein
MKSPLTPPPFETLENRTLMSVTVVDGVEPVTSEQPETVITVSVDTADTAERKQNAREIKGLDEQAGDLQVKTKELAGMYLPCPPWT